MGKKNMENLMGKKNVENLMGNKNWGNFDGEKMGKIGNREDYRGKIDGEEKLGKI